MKTYLQNRVILSVFILSSICVALIASFILLHVKTTLYAGHDVDKAFDIVRGGLFAGMGAIWTLFALASMVNTYLLMREIKIIHKGVRKISTGEFGYELSSENTSSKVKELFQSFNKMSHSLQRFEEQTVEQLTLERNKFEAILLSIANGVVVCDNFDNVVLVNEYADTLLGINSQIKIQDYKDTSGRLCFKDKIEEFKDIPLELMESRPLEFNIEVDDYTVKSVISPMFTRNKEYVGYIIVLIDMTKEAQVDKMRSHFISNVSHELRTPVTVLRSYIDTLYTCSGEFSKEEQQEFLGIINTEIIRLNDMVNDILDFSKLEENDKIEKSLNSIELVIENSVRQLQVLAKENNLTICVSKDKNIAPTLFNYNSIERAFTNLLSNAIKYSPQNTSTGASIEVKISSTNNMIEVSVTDHGCGIAPEHQKQLFDRFYRVETDVHTVKGTGLGLHLVKTAIEKHHAGEVFVESVVGKGSTFGFRLPVNVLEQPNAERLIDINQ